MNKTYEKPVISIDTGISEGVYAASGSGTVTVSDAGIWDRWDGGGKHGFTISWSGLDGTVVVTLNFNDTVDEVAAEGGASATCSGSTATVTFSSTAAGPIYLGVHLNHGTSVDALAVTGHAFSVH